MVRDPPDSCTHAVEDGSAKVLPRHKPRRHRRTALEGWAPAFSVLVNVLIESFCIHARNLIEFLRVDDHCDFDPRWFAAKGYELQPGFIDGRLIGMIAAQIAHLSKDRKRESSDKIDGRQRDVILAHRG
jgi:hypothetical protein